MTIRNQASRAMKKIVKSKEINGQLFHLMTERQEIKQLCQKIENLKPKSGSFPAEWENINSDLLQLIHSNPSLANDSEIICSLVLFASKFSDQEALQLLIDCLSQGIGGNHTLWLTSIAIEHEKQNNFISALNTFEMAKTKEAQPSAFLDLKYSDFKKRMTDRFNSTLSQVNELMENAILELGILDGISYAFINGNIVTKNKDTGNFCDPQIDVLKILEYQANPPSPFTPMAISKVNSATSINISNSISSKQENFLSGYDPSLLVGSDDKECCFEEKRLLSLGHDFIATRKINKNLLNANQSSDTENNGQPSQFDTADQPILLPKKTTREPLKPKLDRPPLPFDYSEKPFLFNKDEMPRSIMKKPNSTNTNNSVNIIRTDRNASLTNHNLSFGFPDQSTHMNSPSPKVKMASVTFDQSVVSLGSPLRKRPPTPIPHSPVLIINEIIKSDSPTIGSLRIEQQIGEHTYLGTNKKDSYVVKPLFKSQQQILALNFYEKVSHSFLFALQADTVHQSPNYFISKYFSTGTLGKLIESNINSGGKKIDENVALYYLLQMIMMLQDLEEQNFVHGEITENHLFLRHASVVQSKVFGLNDPGWRDTGLVLIRCDGLIPARELPAERKLIDRIAVYNIFMMLANNQRRETTAPITLTPCPKKWNETIWKTAFDTLSTLSTLNPLQALIMKEFQDSRKSLNLRIKISRISINDE